MKYKIGDRVKVRSDLVEGEYYDGWYFMTRMGKYKGTKVEITKVYDEHYKLKLLNGRELEGGYTDEMLEPIKGDDNMSVWQKVLDIVNEVHGTDIKMGEEFEIELGCWNPYKFTNDGIKDSEEGTPEILIPYLLSGKRRITQLPWKPKSGETYYCPILLYTSLVKNSVWTNGQADCLRLKRNLICKTEQEAIAKAEHMLKSLETFNWEG